MADTVFDNITIVLTPRDELIERARYHGAAVTDDMTITEITDAIFDAGSDCCAEASRED